MRTHVEKTYIELELNPSMWRTWTKSEPSNPGSGWDQQICRLTGTTAVNAQHSSAILSNVSTRFLSCVSILTRDIDIANPSIGLSITFRRRRRRSRRRKETGAGDSLFARLNNSAYSNKDFTVISLRLPVQWISEQKLYIISWLRENLSNLVLKQFTVSADTT